LDCFAHADALLDYNRREIPGPSGRDMPHDGMALRRFDDQDQVRPKSSRQSTDAYPLRQPTPFFESVPFFANATPLPKGIQLRRSNRNSTPMSSIPSPLTSAKISC
jgi:hypothetical protein